MQIYSNAPAHLVAPLPANSADSGRFVRQLWFGVLLVNLFVIGLAAHSLVSSWSGHVERANTATRNLSLALELGIAGTFDSVDLALRSLVDDYAEKRQSGRFPVDQWNAELQRQRSHLPILAGLRATDASGAILYGLGAEDPQRAVIADRDYFATHREHPDAGLVISRPVFARVTKKWSIVLSRRLNDAGGQFAGIVAATIPLARLGERFAALNLGERGSVAMRDGELRLLVRHPELAGDAQIGSTRVADEFTAALRRDRSAGSYRAGATSIDGIRRIHSFRYNRNYGFFLNVGVAEDDYLSSWRVELVQTGALVGLFLLVTVFFAGELQRTWARQQAAATRLKKSEADFRVLADDAPYGVVLIESDASFAYFNPAFTRMLGYTLAEVPDVAAWWEKAYPDPAYRQMVIAAWQELVLDSTTPGTVDRAFRVCRRDGASREIRFMVVRLEDGRIAVTLEDITERIQAELALKAERDRSQLYLDTMQAIMVALDVDGVITMINPFGCALLGYAADELLGRNWFSTCLPQPEGNATVLPYFQRLMRGEAQNMEYFENQLVTASGGRILVAWHNALLRDGAGRIVGCLGAGEDITERRAAEEEVHNLAFFDSLTGLPNRRLLIDRLQHSMAASTRNLKHRALLFLDLDHFKKLNDTQGHHVGDRLLVETANRLQGCVREGDTVARLGGDEFVVLLEQLSTEVEEAAQQAGAVAEKIIARLCEPCDLGNEHYRGTTSIGIAVFVGQDLSVDEILKRADLAMYQAKAGGRNASCFFDPAMQASIAGRAEMERELRDALERGELVLHYQPQVDQAGRCTGVEALIRWNSPRRGLVSPLDFIPLAEESGLILPVGLWVLREACARLAEWKRDPRTAQLVIAVNVSARQIKQADFVAGVRAVVIGAGVDPALLKLEITESVLVENIDEIVGKMESLQAFGVSFSLDDFGTGYSSLSYVKRLPLDQLKIDKSFVRDIVIDPNDAAICRAIIALGKTLGLAIVAEGVETDQQWQLLTAEECRVAQGYLFARPMPAADFLAWLKAAADR